MPMRVVRMAQKRFIPALIAAAVGLGVWAIFAYRTNAAGNTVEHLCGTLVTIIQQQDQELRQTKEFKQGNPEYIRAHRDNHRIIFQLGCPPVIPKGG